MAKISVKNEIKVYEVNGEEKQSADPLEVRSHDIDSDMVVLRHVGGREITVVASDLIMAVNNSTNVGR